MNTVKYLLLFKGNSAKRGFEASVRGFSKLGAAQAAMDESYIKFAAILNISIVFNASDDKYTTRTKSNVRIERNGDWFQWDIIKAVPEDDGPDGKSAETEPCGLSKYTVTIEEHITQDFSVEACDIFHAMQDVETDYKIGRLAIQRSMPTAHLIMARNDETGETTEWREF